VTFRYTAPEASFKLKVANYWTTTNDIAIDCSRSTQSQPLHQQPQLSIGFEAAARRLANNSSATTLGRPHTPTKQTH